MGNREKVMDARTGAQRNRGGGLKKEAVAFAFFKSVQEICSFDRSCQYKYKEGRDCFAVYTK